MDFPRKMMQVDGLLFEAEQAGVKVWLKEGCVVRVCGSGWYGAGTTPQSWTLCLMQCPCLFSKIKG